MFGVYSIGVCPREYEVCSKGLCPREYVRFLFIGLCPRELGVYPKGYVHGVCTEVIHWSRSKWLWSKSKGACPKSYVQWSMSLGYSLEYVQGDKGYIQRGNSKGICLEVIHWSMSKGVGPRWN